MSVPTPERNPNLHRRGVMAGSAGLFVAAFAGAATGQSASINARMAGDFVPVHDPCIIRQGDTWYLFSTTGSINTEPGGLIPIRTSTDLIHWERKGFVLDTLPTWAAEAVPGSSGAWAPDIALINGRYHLYFSVSTFGSNVSAVGLLTNTTLDPAAPDYRWEDQGIALRSGRFDRFNAIDSNVAQDLDGDWWISWGSFWTGLKIARLDPATGKRADDRVHDIARRPRPSAVEAPFIITRDGYHYLFASHDFCCRGTTSTYKLVCGRSRQITGPYLDVNGASMMEGGGNLVVDADTRFAAMGHNAVLREGERDFLVYHAYDRTAGGAPTLRISPIYWTPDGWPRAAL